MKLHWSPTSPFVRKVMIVAHETGAIDRIETIRTVAAMNEVNPALTADNPLNKLPTLVLDDGSALFDSVVIARFLDTEGLLHPIGREQAIDWARRQALGDGLLDLAVTLRNEMIRPGAVQSEPHKAAWQAKIVNTLDWIEHNRPGFDTETLDIGHIAIGCALHYLDARFAALNWRDGRAASAHWSERFENRPSARLTRFADATGSV